MQKIFITIAGISGILAVSLGAMGAHALSIKLTSDQISSYEIAVKYQFYHTLALLLIALMLDRINSTLPIWAGWCFISGIIFFSGSIYLLSTKDISGIQCSWLGPVTPVGGILFITGWGLVLFSAFKWK